MAQTKEQKKAANRLSSAKRRQREKDSVSKLDTQTKYWQRLLDLHHEAIRKAGLPIPPKDGSTDARPPTSGMSSSEEGAAAAAAPVPRPPQTTQTIDSSLATATELDFAVPLQDLPTQPPQQAYMDPSLFFRNDFQDPMLLNSFARPESDDFFHWPAAGDVMLAPNTDLSAK